MGHEKADGNPWVVAVDLGGTGIKGALVNTQGRLLRYREVPTPAAGFDQVWPRIAGLIAELRNDARDLGGNPIAGVGVGVPGALQPETPDVVSWAPNLKWRAVPLGQCLREVSGLPVYLENDADLAAVGEYWQGAGREFTSFAVVTVGTGVGCGLVLDGRLYRGAAGTAGELGHMILLADGPECSCGRRGCLETLVAAPALIRLARERYTGPGPLPREARDVFAAAGRGEPPAGAIVREVAYYLGWGFANMLNLLNLEAIIVGGGVGQAGELLLGPVRETVARLALPAAGSLCQIVPAHLGNTAGIIGAAALVLRKRGLML